MFHSLKETCYTFLWRIDVYDMCYVYPSSEVLEWWPFFEILIYPCKEIVKMILYNMVSVIVLVLYKLHALVHFRLYLRISKLTLYLIMAWQSQAMWKVYNYVSKLNWKLFMCDIGMFFNSWLHSQMLYTLCFLICLNRIVEVISV